MIDIVCECGKALSFAETRINTPLSCDSCRRELYFACAESLPDGAGAGDFDAALCVRNGPLHKGQRISIGGVPEVTIGKEAGCTIQLASRFASRHHCKLVRLDFGPSRWKLVDTGSSNGTFVNGQRITEHELNPGDTVDIGEYELQYDVAAEATPSAAVPAAPAAPTGPVCPSCGKELAAKAKFCVDCGIDVKTGRAVAMSREFDENTFAVNADTWIRMVSWLIPIGLFPVASEAMGTRKPIAVWVIAAITVVASIAFFVACASQRDEPSADVLNLMLWTGTPSSTGGGSVSDYLEELRKESQTQKGIKPLTERQMLKLAQKLAEENQPAPEGVGFRWYQPLTCAFLHGGIMHLAGNLLFLIVFGMRVNELVGNLKFAIVYPLLAFASGWAYILTAHAGPPHPMLGASGAIMGLAGMYFIFFPVQRVHTAIWLRLRFWCAYKVFAMRGFWLLLLWIGFNDVMMMFLSSSDGVAHWAHVGGFAAGSFAALGLMVARLTNANGSDLLSVVLGRRAWALLGKPAARVGKQVTPPAPAVRATSMNYPGA